MTLPSLKELLNVATSCTINSEPYEWYIQGSNNRVLFENINSEFQFTLNLDSLPTEYKNDSYLFECTHTTSKTIWIEFRITQVLSPDLLMENG